MSFNEFSNHFALGLFAFNLQTDDFFQWDCSHLGSKFLYYVWNLNGIQTENDSYIVLAKRSFFFIRKFTIFAIMQVKICKGSNSNAKSFALSKFNILIKICWIFYLFSSLILQEIHWHFLKNLNAYSQKLKFQTLFK
jgi:hypothetical protein